MNHIHCDKSLDAAASFCIGVAQRNLDCNLGTYILWYFFVQIYFMQRSILLAYVCVPYICSAQGGQKRVSDLLELVSIMRTLKFLVYFIKCMYLLIPL